MVKKVNVYPTNPIVTLNIPLRTRVMGINMDAEDIRKCIIAQAIVEEVLPTGDVVKLDFSNYNKDNSIVKEEIKASSTIAENTNNQFKSIDFKNLSRKESDLISREDKITNEEESINQKIKVISEEKTKIDYKEKVQREKDFDQQFREENLDHQETRLKEKEKRLLQKEIDIEKRAEKVNKIAAPLEEKEQRLSELENDLSEREKVILGKVKNAIEKEALANKKLIEARNEKQLSKNARIEAKELYEKNREQIEKFNFENQDKIKKIDEWEAAAKEINESEDWIKNEFNEYNRNRYTENAFQKFYQKIKIGVAAAISKVKESYDEKIRNLKERLFGHKKIFHKGNKIACEYSYGESDYADMLRDTPVSDIEQAISDTRKKGKQTFSEAAALEEGFSFYERYFSKAKTLAKEREIELSKERERASISR